VEGKGKESERRKRERGRYRHSEEVVDGSGRVLVEDVRREVEAFEGEVDEVVEAVAELVATTVTEALQVDDENLRSAPDLNLLESLDVVLAIGAIPISKMRQRRTETRQRAHHLSSAPSCS
jgi:hypothetical protein